MESFRDVGEFRDPGCLAARLVHFQLGSTRQLTRVQLPLTHGILARFHRHIYLQLSLSLIEYVNAQAI